MSEIISITFPNLIDSKTGKPAVVETDATGKSQYYKDKMRKEASSFAESIKNAK